MKLKTSTKISLRFTFMTMLVLCFFSCLIFFLFFNTRYYKQQDLLLNEWEYPIPTFLKIIHDWDDSFYHNINKPEFDKWNKHSETPQLQNESRLPHFAHNIKQEIRFFSLQELDKNAITLWTKWHRLLNLLSTSETALMFYNEHYYLYHQISDTDVKAIDITWFIIAQFELWELLIFWDLIFLVIIFLASIYFVWSGLRKLKKLANYAENLNVDNLSLPFSINEEDSDKDEIKLIWKALNSSLLRVNSQISSLRDFIANASHELKTPLMMMNTEIDIALKKKDYESHLKNLKVSTKRMAELVDSLSLITRLESNSKLEKESSLVYPICDNTISQIKKVYPKITIKIIETNSWIKKELHEWLFSIVIKNLVENACKHAWNNITIQITISQDSLIINDNWIWIEEEDLKHLFDRFWQSKKSEQWKKWFWLWLYLVKKISDLHERKIDVESKLDKWTTFTINW